MSINVEFGGKKVGVVRRESIALVLSVVMLASCSYLMPQPTLQERQALCDQLDALKKADAPRFEKMHPAQQAEFTEALSKSLYKVLNQFEAPKKDGKKYYGEIKIHLDAQGVIVKTIVSIPSGSLALDQEMLNAANTTKQLVLPEDKCVARVMTTYPVVLSYTEQDMK